MRHITQVLSFSVFQILTFRENDQHTKINTVPTPKSSIMSKKVVFRFLLVCLIGISELWVSVDAHTRRRMFSMIKAKGKMLRTPTCLTATTILTSESILLASRLLKVTSTKIIVGVNASVFFLWLLSRTSAAVFRWMSRHFLLPYNKNQLGVNPHTLITSTFSHINFWHIFSNMFALLMFGEQLEPRMRHRTYVYLYVISGLMANVGDVVFFYQPERQAFVSLGASGAICAIEMFFCLKFPNVRFYFFDEALSARWTVLLWFLKDLGKIGSESNVGHSAHVAGYVFGAFSFLVMNGSMWRQSLLSVQARRGLKRQFRRWNRQFRRWRRRALY